MVATGSINIFTVTNHTVRHYKRTLPGILFCALVLLGTCSYKAFGQDVQIYLDSTAQVINGFGAANIVNWRPDMTDNEINEAFGTDDGQLGFSILRIRIPPNQDEWSDYVPTAKKAYDMGVKIIASPWSPPADMKTNNNLVGGSLKDDEYAAYAAHLKAFVDYMADNGVHLYAVSVQNEPDIQVGYESCDWTPDQMLRFVKEYGDSVGTRLMAPESFQFRRNMSDPLLEDSVACAHLDIVAGHIYGGGLGKYPLAEEKGKPVWMTEHYTESNHSGNDWPLALDVATEMQNVMKADMSAYVWWYIVRFYGPIGDGEEGTREGAITKRGYIMSQFARFIRPGYVRVYTKGPTSDTYPPQYSDISVTAYKDSSSKVVIVAENSGTSSQKINFILGDKTSGVFHVYITSATQNAEKINDITTSNSGLSATLPAQSITTFVSNERSTGIEKQAGVPQSYRLLQNYPNPFNPSTTIRYQVPTAAHVTLKVFDILGREVATLVDGNVSAGEHQTRFYASRLASGIYIYRLRAGSFVQIRNMTLIK